MPFSQVLQKGVLKRPAQVGDRGQKSGQWKWAQVNVKFSNFCIYMCDKQKVTDFFQLVLVIPIHPSFDTTPTLDLNSAAI